MPTRRTVLLLHHDGQLLDLLTRLFEARGYAVVLAATVGQALTHLGGERDLDAIVAAWDAHHPAGGEAYRWTLEQRFELRDRFVFLTEDPPPELDRLVAGRCLTVRPTETAEILRVVAAIAARVARARETEAQVVWADGAPTLLLADDDPVVLAAMGALLRDAGFAVTAVDSGNAAITELDRGDVDVILVEWAMVNGSGAHVFQWIVTFRPWLVDRVAFLIEAQDERQATAGPGRPTFWKGADAGDMIGALRRLAGR
ncbi:MAG: response regulator [Kofleriaceae bacterium]|nr:response regulator [Kofleriaceae bacterium]MBP9168119.1 response regulator [Kofleriaceae bacterium]MBP9856503.1 response regulator [Kofleriaceae bacterium]